MSNTSIKVWDLPTRLFHWTLVGLFGGAFAVAHLAGEHKPAFAIHMLLGLILMAAVAFRLAWGLVGSRHARFSSFLFSPAALVAYVKEAFAGRDRPSAGHNPGSSWAIYAMLTLPVLLVVSGLKAQGKSELFEDVHGALGWIMVAAVAAHLAGLAFHTFRHKEPIALAMITGQRRGEPAEAIGSSHPLAALLFLLLVGGWAALVLRGHDPVLKVVKLPGIDRTIPVAEKAPEAGKAGGRDEEDDD
jgi:cytochrome b